MEETSQQRSVWHDRWWFIARLFAAFTVISFFHHIAESLLSPMTVRSSIMAEQEWGIWGVFLLPAFGFGWVYFIGGIFVVRYFRETWLQTTLGIAAVGITYSVISTFFPWSAFFVGTFLWGTADINFGAAGNSWINVGATNVYFIVLLAFVIAGGAFRNILDRSQAPLRELSFLGQIFVSYVATTSLAASLVQIVDQSQIHFTDHRFADIFFSGGFQAETWSYVLAYSAVEAIFFVPLIYLASGLFSEPWRKVSLAMFAVGASAAFLPEILKVMVYPWHLDVSYNAAAELGSLQGPRNHWEQDKLALMADYFRKNSLPNMVQYLLVLFTGLAAIALRHYVPPDQLKPTIDRIRRWN